MAVLKVLMLSFLLVLTPYIASAEAGGPKGVPGQSESTPENYQAQAEMYQNRAEKARENAERHRKMAASYIGGRKARYSMKMREHCNTIVSLEEELVSEYESLAAALEAAARK